MTTEDFMAKLLQQIGEMKGIQHQILHRLYGEEGDEGDIPAIRNHLKTINGRCVIEDRRLGGLEEYERVNERRWDLVRGGLRVALGVILGGSGVGAVLNWLHLF